MEREKNNISFRYSISDLIHEQVFRIEAVRPQSRLLGAPNLSCIQFPSLLLLESFARCDSDANNLASDHEDATAPSSLLAASIHYANAIFKTVRLNLSA